MVKKKLIEVALPLEAINKESAREKSIRHGHPSTLHLWWARRPLAAARAVIWSSLVDDPSSLPEQFPTEEAQDNERKRLFGILERLVKWENSNNQEVLAEAKAEIMKSTGGNPPALLDPFAGGGSIPLEAQRLGLEAHASDLNPVAVMINKAMIEIPPKFAGQPPVNPDARVNRMNQTWTGAQGLAEDVRYYGEWMKKEAFKRIGHLYPNIDGKPVIAWIWARTVKCPNPACECIMPLVHSFELSKKKGNEVFAKPITSGNKVSFVIEKGKNTPDGTVGRTGAKCICCGAPVELDYVRREGKTHRLGAQLLAIVAENKGGRLYYAPNEQHVNAAQCMIPDNIPSSELPEKALGFRVQSYGMTNHSRLFTNRQLTGLSTFSKLVGEAIDRIMSDGGSPEYANALATYLAFSVDKSADVGSTICSWININGVVRNTFARPTISMVWDYTEVNPFSSSTGSYKLIIDKISECVSMLPGKGSANVRQFDAQSDNGLRNIMVSSDPPYYDNIGYADLSDFFYIWMRLALKDIYPSLFNTMLVPKTEELIATPYRFDGSMEAARNFFEKGMAKSFSQIYEYARDDVPVTIYYAFKQSVAYEDEICGDKKTVSSGWETMLSAIVLSGFCITGTWPVSTEKIGRTRDITSNALASSIVLVCRKRPPDAPTTTRRDFINTLKRELKPALQKLQASNIAPVDLAQSAIGPGMGVYSRFLKVLEADGTPMSVRSALQIINQELDLYFTEQDGELDRESRFCVDLYTQYAFSDMKYGEADVLARAKNTSIEKLRSAGILYAEKGVVRLLTRDKINMTPASLTKSHLDDGVIWLLTQQLTHALETDGVVGTAKIVANYITSEPEQAKALAYRLFQIAERKGWATEAYAYNSLVIAWPEVQSKAADIQAANKGGEQMTYIPRND